MLEFYSSLISFFLQIMFTMLFFLILCMKFLYFISLLKILFILFTLYHKYSFFFMFKTFHKFSNFYSQLILIIINLTSFCCVIMNSYLLLYNMICKIDNEIHLYIMLTKNLLILFCVWIEVKKVKRSQFNAVWMMLERYMIRKVIMQSFHSYDNILSNSHNQSTKKINDMSMSVRNEKILLVKNITQMKSLQIVTTSDWRICNSLTALILKHLHHIDSVVE